MISSYLPPSKALIPEDLNVLSRTTNQIIVEGDLNAKHQKWHFLVSNVKGRILFNHQQNHRSKYIITAPTEPTHYAKTGTPDILDIFLLMNITDGHTIKTENQLSSRHRRINRSNHQ